MDTEVENESSRWFNRLKVVATTTAIILAAAVAVWVSLSYAPYTVGP